MQNTNQSLLKLKSIARFLQISGKYYFVNYNLKLFFDFITKDSEIGSIVRKVVDTIVSTQLDIRVYGHLPINTSIIANIWRGGVQEVEYGTKCRDRQDGTQFLASDILLGPNSKFYQDKTIPFELHIIMPPPRYYPVILERDEKGRIVNSKFSPIEL